ncbi:MAG: hypothetical protein M1830_003759 [Pleopsidium flavum]|nr:MAG: hypothetical protein M1830_003759 [Pleopsidium flavum]
MASIPITIITGFLGSGKTTLILNLIPQLPKSYKLALLKNEFGDLAIDSQLASSSAISGVQELLNGCICCNLVGQLGDALDTLRTDVAPDRIIIETSGSAFPATLAMEVNRLGRETGNYVLDGVVVVIDVENWEGYEDTSYTAKLQARYTDLIVFNKWEHVDERRFDDCLDRVGDLELEVAWVKSNKGRVGKDIILGIDGGLAKDMSLDQHSAKHENRTIHDHESDHQSEVEVLSVTLSASSKSSESVNMGHLESLLRSAPKDEVYRIKAILTASRPPTSSDGGIYEPSSEGKGHPVQYILNWAFGRWTFTPLITATLQANGSRPLPTPPDSTPESPALGPETQVLRMTLILARYEADKWKKRIESGVHIGVENDGAQASLQVERVL